MNFSRYYREAFDPNIIKMILPKDYSEMVIKKIQEELSK